MGLDLGPLTSITKALDPGQYIKQGLNSILPKNMAVVGDLAGAVFDLKTGNLVGAAQLGMDAMKDLPQATKSLQQQGAQGAANNGAAASANPNLEPSPPPNGSKPIDMNQLADMLNKLLEALGNKQPTTTHSGPFEAMNAPPQMKERLAATANAQSGGAANTTTTTTTARHETTSGWRGSPTTQSAPTSPEWRGSPTTPPPSTTTDPPAASAPPASSPTINTAAPAATSTAPTPVADAPPSAAGSTSGQTISSLAQFNSMSDSAVRDAVIHGRISPELAKDQTAMMAIQQRMNAISEMNNLMTNMMKALHDMQMAVIQNVRV
jgi:hypothetical protein